MVGKVLTLQAPSLRKESSMNANKIENITLGELSDIVLNVIIPSGHASPFEAVDTTGELFTIVAGFEYAQYSPSFWKQVLENIGEVTGAECRGHYIGNEFIILTGLKADPMNDEAPLMPLKSA